MIVLSQRRSLYFVAQPVDLGKFGQSLKIRITRTFVKIRDGKEEKEDKTTYEQGNLFVLPDNSFVKSKKAFFYFNSDKFDLLEAIGIQLNDKRHFNLTETELQQWFSVSVGGLKDLFVDNYDEKAQSRPKMPSEDYINKKYQDKIS